jgi:hypothetical protein
MFDGNGGNNKNADPMKMVFRLIASLQKIWDAIVSGAISVWFTSGFGLVFLLLIIQGTQQDYLWQVSTEFHWVIRLVW